MKEFNVEIDGKSFLYTLLQIKTGKTVKNQNGDDIGNVIMGVQDYSVFFQDYKQQVTLILGTWKDADRYNCFLRGQPNCQPYTNASLVFSENSVPISYLNQLVRDKNFLFGLEFTEQFLNVLLALPDNGGTFGDTWEVIPDDE